MSEKISLDSSDILYIFGERYAHPAVSNAKLPKKTHHETCLLYTSDAADE